VNDNKTSEPTVVYVADLNDDIDDLIAIEFLHYNNYLKYVVLDSDNENVDITRVNYLKNIGVIFKSKIEDNEKYIFVGGSLKPVVSFMERGNNPEHLIIQGGFAGTGIVAPKDVLKKFKDKEAIRTYNLNRDMTSSKYIIANINRMKNLPIFVSKNVCHSKKNTISKLHNDDFLKKYKNIRKKLLHDLLMVKEGINHIKKVDTILGYKKVKLMIFKDNDIYSEWGSITTDTPNCYISTYYK
jgi:tRNA isopentenyl-2-thiomethyl-A-37 hydroxylase MiaE